jgi:hypothetical protein
MLQDRVFDVSWRPGDAGKGAVLATASDDSTMRLWAVDPPTTGQLTPPPPLSQLSLAADDAHRVTWCWAYESCALIAANDQRPCQGARTHTLPPVDGWSGEGAGAGTRALGCVKHSGPVLRVAWGPSTSKGGLLASGTAEGQVSAGVLTRGAQQVVFSRQVLNQFSQPMR